MNPQSRQLTLQTPDALSGDCVVYVMSRDQRAHDNHALLAAQAEAIEHSLPLYVLFVFYAQSGHRSKEQYLFMIKGLKEVEQTLSNHAIPFVKLCGTMPEQVSAFAKKHRPRTVYCDFSPLRGPRKSQKKLASQLESRVIVVDTHNVVPVWVLSDKEEYAAHTIRRKLHKVVADWVKAPSTLKKHPVKSSRPLEDCGWETVMKQVESLPSSGVQHEFTPGEAAARQAVKEFSKNGLGAYAKSRNDANEDAASNVSPYLHFGQVSSLRILLTLMDDHSHPPQIITSFKLPSHDGSATIANGIDSFVEELVVRKELADNFCFYNAHYDSLDGAKDWARQTLQKHASDPREHVYTKQQLFDAQTHDDLWNAAQTQLRRTGKMHGYLRMYWAKMFLAWTNNPETAIRWAIECNDMYHLDGGDPNGYVGVLWSIAGLHDRPWFERDVFGTIRYMALSGAKKQFDTDTYIETWLKKK